MDKWDPRKDDFNDQKFNSYVKGPGKNLPTNRVKGDKYVQLFITGIPNEITQDGLNNLFSRAGKVISSRKMQSKKEGAGDTYGFVTMANAIDAERAIREFHNFRIERFTLRVQVSRNEADNRRRNFQSDLTLNFMGDAAFNDDGIDADANTPEDMTPTGSTNLNGSTMNGFGAVPAPTGAGRGQMLAELSSASGVALGTAGNTTLQSPGQLSVNVGESGVGRGITIDPSSTPMPTPVPMSGRKQPLPDYNTDHIGRGGSNKSQRGGRCYTRGGYGRGYQDSYYDNQSQGGGYRGRGGGGGGGHRGGRGGHGGGYMEQYGGGPGEGYGRGMPFPPQQHPMMYSMPMMDPYTYGMMAAGAAASTQHLLQPAYPAMMGPTGAAGPQYQPNTSVSEKRNVNRNKEELTNECSVCGSVGRLRCSVCKEPYCSPDCQKRDWPEHKKVCKVISSEKELSAEFSNTFDVSVGDELIPKVKELMEKAVGGSIEISRKPPKPSQSQSARGGEPKSGHVSEAEGDTKPRAGDRGSTDERRNNNNSGAGGDRKKSYSGDSQDGGSGGAKKFANADGGGAKKAQGSCFNCGSTDHYRQDCKEPIGINKNCFKCGGKGHLSKDCQNKEENRSSDKKCYNCQKTGHFSRECPEKSENRRDNRPPSTPHGKKEMTNGDNLSTSRPFNPAPTTLSTPVTAQTRKPTASPPPKKSLATEALPVNEEVQVVVTEVVDPSNIYVQVLNEEKVLLLSKIMTEMAEKYESSKSDVSSAMVGEIYACQYSEDHAWYRAQVVRRDERAHVTVAYVDFGNQERTEQGCLRQLDPNMMKLPAQAVLCSLEDLQPVSGTEWKFAKADLEKYITPNMAYKITCNKALDGPTGKCHDVTMTNGAGDSVAQSLVSAGFARKSPTPSPAGSPQVPVSDGPPMVRDLARVQTGLVEGQKIPVFITDAATPLRFTVQVLTDSNIQAYQEFNLAFQQLYNTQEDIYNPTAIGELVASRFSGDEDWYRGEVTSISGDTANIRFIDFGNSETVKKFEIRRALPMTMNVPVQAVYCCMHGVEEPSGGLWPEDALKFLHNMLMQPMVATVVEFQDKRASLELFQDTVGSVNNKVKEIIRKVLPAKSTSQPASAETKPSSAPSKTPTKPTDVASSASSAKQAAASVTASTERGKVSKAASLPLDGTKVEVIVGMITSLKSFYLLLADSGTQQKYVKLQQDLYVHYQTAVPYSPTPYDALVGEVVAYCNMEPEPVRWERALITEKLEGGVYNAFHIDSGNSSKRVDGLSVKRLDAQFCALPSRAIPCRLAGCEALDHTKQLEKLGEALKHPTLARAVNFMNNVYSMEIYKPDNTNLLKWLVASTEPSQPVATAAATSTPDNTSNSKPHTVASTACSAATQGVNQHVQIKETSLPTDGSQALGVVVFIESLSSFCVQLFTEDLRDTLARLNTLNQVCEKDTIVYTPSIGEHVSAMFTTDSEWYRAVVRGQTKAGYEVYFIDFGNDDVVPETAIRKHCLALDGIPAMAVRCRLAGLTGEEDIELQKEFNMMLNQRVMVQVKGKLEDRYSVELFLTNDEATSVNKVLKLDPSFVPATATNQQPATPSSPAVPTQPAVSSPTVPGSSHVVPTRESGPSASTHTPEVPSSAAHGPTVVPTIATERLPIDEPLAAAPMLINNVIDFYVQSADETKQRHLLEILLKLQEVYKDSTSLYSPSIGEFVAVLFNDGADELWYRAEVLSVEQDEQYTLFLIDYGNVIKLMGNLTRELHPSLFTHPCLAHKCSLAGFDIVSEVVTNKFSEMTLNKEVTITVKAFENGIYVVDLVHEGINITEHLLPLLGTALASSSSSTAAAAAATTDIVDHLPKQETPPRKEALPRKSASPSSGERKVVFAQTLAQCHPEEDNINVVITSVVRPNQFHCQVFQESHTNLQELKLLTDSMKMDCEHSLSVANTKFEVGELCCAKFPEDGEWYRAKVLEVFPDNTAKVLYVDYGNQCEVPVSELRPVRLEYTVLPRLAFTCSLHGVSPTGVSWSAEATTKLREFENRPLRARVTEVQGSVYELELEDVSGGGESVAKQLITAGLATPTKPAAESKEDKVDHLERQNQLLQQQINDMQAMMAQMMKK